MAILDPNAGQKPAPTYNQENDTYSFEPIQVTPQENIYKDFADKISIKRDITSAKFNQKRDQIGPYDKHIIEPLNQQEQEARSYLDEQQLLKDYFGDKYAKDGGIDNDGRIGETMDIAQSSFMNLGSRAEGLVENAIKDTFLERWTNKLDSITGADKTEGWIKSNWRDSNEAMLDAGVKESTINEYNKDMLESQENWKKGNYVDSITGMAKNIDRMLAQSTGDMALTMAGPFGPAMYAAVRTNDQVNEFRENNNGDNPSSKQLASSFLTNLALGYGERFVLSGIFDDTARSLGFTKTEIPKLKTETLKAVKSNKPLPKQSPTKLTKDVSPIGSILKSASGETIQEYGEGVADAYFGQKQGERDLLDIATDPEQAWQGAAGGLMGGAMSGGSLGGAKALEAAGVAKNKASELKDEFNPDAKAKKEAKKHYTKTDVIQLKHDLEQASDPERKKQAVEMAKLYSQDVVSKLNSDYDIDTKDIVKDLDDGVEKYITIAGFGDSKIMREVGTNNFFTNIVTDALKSNTPKEKIKELKNAISETSKYANSFRLDQIFTESLAKKMTEIVSDPKNKNAISSEQEGQSPKMALNKDRAEQAKQELDEMYSLFADIVSEDEKKNINTVVEESKKLLDEYVYGLPKDIDSVRNEVLFSAYDGKYKSGKKSVLGHFQDLKDAASTGNTKAGKRTANKVGNFASSRYKKVNDKNYKDYVFTDKLLNQIKTENDLFLEGLEDMIDVAKTFPDGEDKVKIIKNLEGSKQVLKESNRIINKRLKEGDYKQAKQNQEPKTKQKSTKEVEQTENVNIEEIDKQIQAKKQTETPVKAQETSKPNETSSEQEKAPEEQVLNQEEVKTSEEIKKLSSNNQIDSENKIDDEEVKEYIEKEQAKELSKEISQLEKQLEKLKKDKIEIKRGNVGYGKKETLEIIEYELQETKNKLKELKTLKSLDGTVPFNLYSKFDNRQDKVFKLPGSKEVNLFDQNINFFSQSNPDLNEVFSKLLNILPKSFQEKFQKDEDFKNESVSAYKFINEFTKNLNIAPQKIGFDSHGKLNKIHWFDIDENGFIEYKSEEQKGDRFNAKSLPNPLLLFINDDSNFIKDDKNNVYARLPKEVEEIVKFYSFDMIADALKITRQALTMEDSELAEIFNIENDSNDKKFRDQLDIARNLLSNGVIPKHLITRTAGKKIFNAIGLKINPNMEQYTREEIEQALGLLAYISLENNQDIFENVDSEDQRLRLFKISDNILNNKDIKNKITKTSNMFSWFMPSEKGFMPSLDPKEIKVDMTVRNQPYYRLSNEAKRQQIEEKQKAWTLNDIAFDLFDTDNFTKEELLDLFGSKTIDENLNPNDYANVKGKNLTIENDINSLQSFVKMIKDKEFFFKWANTVSGRYLLDSILSPQASKIVRFMMSKNDMRSNFNRNDLSDNSENMKLAKLAFAQAFDIADVDKNSDTNVLDEINSNWFNIENNKLILKNKDLKKAMRYLKTKDNKYKKDLISFIKEYGEEPGHALQALDFLNKLDNFISEPNKNEFTHELVIEADGITSGMILTLMQIATPQAMDLLVKGGVYTEDAINEWLPKLKEAKVIPQDQNWFTHGHLLAYNKTDYAKKRGEIFTDFYNTVAMDIKNEIEESYSPGKKSPMNTFTSKQNSNKNKFGASLVKDLVGEIKRKVAKKPVMVFIYGSSLNNIKKKLAETLGKDNLIKNIKSISNKYPSLEADTILNLFDSNSIEDLANRYQTVEEAKNAVVKKIKSKAKNLTDEEISALLLLSMVMNDAKKLVYQKVNNDGSIESIDTRKDKAYIQNIVITEDMVDSIKNFTDVNFGSAIEKSFNKRFSDIVKYRKIVKYFELGNFYVYKTMFNKKLNELKKQKNKISIKDINRIEKELIDEGYGHDTYSVSGYLQSKRKSEPKDGSKQVQVSSGLNNKVITGYIGEKEEVPNIGAAGTIDIHQIDGSMIENTDHNTGRGSLNIYDAEVMSTDIEQYFNVLEEYNNQVVSKSNNFGVIDKAMKKFNKAFEKLSDEDKSELYKNILSDKNLDKYIKRINEKKDPDDFKVTIENMIEILNSRNNNLSQDLHVEHMYIADLKPFKVDGSKYIDRTAYDYVPTSSKWLLETISDSYSDTANRSFDYKQKKDGEQSVEPDFEYEYYKQTNEKDSNYKNAVSGEKFEVKDLSKDYFYKNKHSVLDKFIKAENNKMQDLSDAFKKNYKKAIKEIMSEIEGKNSWKNKWIKKTSPIVKTNQIVKVNEKSKQTEPSSEESISDIGSVKAQNESIQEANNIDQYQAFSNKRGFENLTSADKRWIKKFFEDRANFKPLTKRTLDKYYRLSRLADEPVRQKKKRLSSQAEALKNASIDNTPIGGSETEQLDKQKQIMRKDIDSDIKSLSREDIAYLDSYYKTSYDEEYFKNRYELYLENADTPMSYDAYKEYIKLNEMMNIDDISKEAFNKVIEGKKGVRNEFKIFEDLRELLFDDLEKAGLLVNDDVANPKDSDYINNLFDTVVIFEDAIEDLSEDDVKVTLEEYESKGVVSRGKVDLNNKKIILINSPDSRLTTHSEVLVHEVLHLMTEEALRKDNALKQRINDVQRQIAKKYDYRIFLKNIDNPTTEEIETAKLMFDYSVNGSESEFLAYFNTNQSMFDSIKDEPIKIKYLEEFDLDNIDKKANRLEYSVKKFINKAFIRVINKLIPAAKIMMQRAVEQGMFNPKYIPDSLLKKDNITKEMQNVLKELTYLQMREQTMPEPEMTKLDKILDDIKTTNKKVRESMNQVDEAMKNTIELSKQKISKTVFSKIVDSIAENKIARKLMDNRTINSIVNTTFRSTNQEDVALFYDLFRKIKYQNEKLKEQEKQVLLNLTSQLVKNASDSEKKAIKRSLLDTDLQSLDMSENDLLELLNDENILNSKIKEYQNKIYSLNTKKSSIANAYINASEELGYYIATKNNKSANLQKNAYNIFMGYWQRFGFNPQEENQEEMIKAIDGLASLYALKHIGSETKKVAADYMSKNRKNTKLLLDIHKTQMEKFSKDIFNGQRRFMVKGYTSEPQLSNMKFAIVKESDLEMKTTIMRHKVVKEMSEYSNIGMKEKMYITVHTGHEVGKTEGIIDTITWDHSGTSISEILKAQGYDADTIEAAINELRKINVKYLFKKPGFRDIENEPNRLIPVTDLNGNIVDFKTEFSHEDKVKYLTIDDRVDQVIANTVTSSYAKAKALFSNIESIDFLIDYYDKYYDQMPNKFITIRATTPEERKKGKEYKYATEWAMIPEYTRKYIFNKTGKPEITVRQDMLDDIIGYKDFSFSQVLINVLGMKETSSIVEAIITLEDYWKDIVGRFKKFVVTISGATILGNLVSNMFVSLVHGIPPMEYVKRVKEAWTELDKYNEDLERKNKLEILIAAGQKQYENEYKKLDYDIKHNKLHTLIENGLHSPIIEDINADIYHDKSPVSQQIDKIFDNEKIPEPIRDFRDMLYVSDNTSFYKKLLKLTQYGDIVSRYAVFKHNEAEGMSEIENIRYVDQLFVNYSYNDDKMIQYMNDMGMLLFTKYLFRSVKAMIMMAKRNPLYSGLFQGSQYLTGIDVVDPMDPYYHVLNALENRIGNPSEMIFDVASIKIDDVIPNFGVVVNDW